MGLFYCDNDNEKRSLITQNEGTFVAKRQSPLIPKAKMAHWKLALWTGKYDSKQNGNYKFTNNICAGEVLRIKGRRQEIQFGGLESIALLIKITTFEKRTKMIHDILCL